MTLLHMCNDSRAWLADMQRHGTCVNIQTLAQKPTGNCLSLLHNVTQNFFKNVTFNF